MSRSYRIGIGLLLLAVCAIGALTPALPARAQSLSVTFQEVASNFGNIVHMTHANDSSDRLFVVEQAGIIKIVKNGAVLDTPFLDISGKNNISCCGERGLLSVAFPPGFATSGRFYVYYTKPNGDLAIVRFQVSGNPDVANPNSAQPVLTIPHPGYGNHNGGQLAFGPDGYLYAGTGDGGGGGDPDENSQDLTSLLGKILRLDVEALNTTTYLVPSDNPFRGRSDARPEIWAYGLRNPWRFSFDRANGDLYIGDVGQGSYEEIDWQPASSKGGENYGWDITEGNACYEPSSGCDTSGITLPVLAYSHASTGGCSVTGGYVYRGTAFPQLYGRYIYADYCNGALWTLRIENGKAVDQQRLRETGPAISSFGEDQAGNLYAVGYSGTLYRVIERNLGNNVFLASIRR